MQITITGNYGDASLVARPVTKSGILNPYFCWSVTDGEESMIYSNVDLFDLIDQEIRPIN